MNQKLKTGDQAPTIETLNVLGSQVTVPHHKNLIHLQFQRFAGCPVCNLQMQSYIKRIDEIKALGIQEVVFFHSEKKLLVDYQGQFPFDVVADPQKVFYQKYKVESSPWAILSPSAWPALIKGYLVKPSGIPDSSTLGLPAEFLISSDGLIIDSYYGAHSSDQWSVDELLQIAKVHKNGRTPS